jgi:DNA-binding NarL/FixJ family response regulator
MEPQTQNNQDKISTWIVDDNKNFCLVLAVNLNKSKTVDCQRFFHSCKTLLRDLETEISPPSVILLDIKMPAMNGLDAIVPIKKLSPGSNIIMLTSYDLDENIRAAMKRGASGYLLKTASPDEIVRAIESVQQGGVPLDPMITKKMMSAYIGWEGPENVYNLSPREKNVLKLVTQGMNNLEIAEKLFISRFTVETHLRNLFHKLDIHSRPKLVVKAIKDRMV